MKNHCCQTMTHQVNYDSEEYSNQIDFHDNLIKYNDQFDEYRIIIHNGGNSSIAINYCPWCGLKLPKSKRELWFDILQKLGFDEPFEQDIPNEFKTDEWYRNKIKKRKKIITINIGLLFIIISSIILMFTYDNRPIAQINSKITESQLLRDLEKINEDELTMEYIKIEDNGFFERHKVSDEQGNIIPNSKVLGMSVQNKEDDFIEPLEVRAAFRSWIYLSNHKTPDPIVGVIVWFDLKWGMDAPTDLFISKSDFENTLKQVENYKQLKEEDLLQKLSSIWIQNNNYTPKNQFNP